MKFPSRQSSSSMSLVSLSPRYIDNNVFIASSPPLGTSSHKPTPKLRETLMSASTLLNLDRSSSVGTRRLELHPDRAFPADERQRAVAREIYGQTALLPLICMHGHVEADVFAANEPFADPAQLLVVPDHYVTRMMVSQESLLSPWACRGSTAVRWRLTRGPSGGRFARTGSCSAAPRPATGWSMSWSRSSGSTSCPAPKLPMRSTIRSPLALRSRTSGPGNCWSGFRSS